MGTTEQTKHRKRGRLLALITAVFLGASSAMILSPTAASAAPDDEGYWWSIAYTQTGTDTILDAEVGDVIDYSFTVENQGSSDGKPFTDLSIEDLSGGLSEISYDWSGAEVEGVLEFGETLSASASYTVTAEDLRKGSASSETLLHFRAFGDQELELDANHTTWLIPIVSLDLTITPSTERAEIGEEIVFSLELTNTSLAPLTEVSISEPTSRLSALSYDWSDVESEGVLQPGERLRATASYSAQETDLLPGMDTGSLFSFATAEGFYYWPQDELSYSRAVAEAGSSVEIYRVPAPVEPEVPEEPEVPTPEEPKVPEEPTPEIPEETEQPQVPTPEEPQVPEAPAPSAPEQPEAPVDNPAAPKEAPVLATTGGSMPWLAGGVGLVLTAAGALLVGRRVGA